jgi:hypothetical protein
MTLLAAADVLQSLAPSPTSRNSMEFAPVRGNALLNIAYYRRQIKAHRSRKGRFPKIHDYCLAVLTQRHILVICAARLAILA